jgi:hypothetical protein
MTVNGMFITQKWNLTVNPFFITRAPGAHVIKPTTDVNYRICDATTETKFPLQISVIYGENKLNSQAERPYVCNCTSNVHNYGLKVHL